MPTGSRPDPPIHSAHFSMLGTVDTFPWACTFWVRNGNAVEPTQADFTSLTSAAGAHWSAAFMSHLSRQVHLAEVSSLYYNVGGASMAGAVANTDVGTMAEDALPVNVACCVGWRVQAHYRGGHPRMYLPGIPPSVLANRRSFTAAFASAIAAAGNQFHGAINSLSSGAFTGAKLGTVSFVNRKEWRSPPLFRDFVLTSSHCDQRIDSMRRRLGRDIPP